MSVVTVISVAEPEPKAEIKLPPGAGAEAEITNCDSGSFIFIKDLVKFYRRKTIVAKEIFVIFHSFKKSFKKSTSTQVKKGICQGFLQNLFGAGAGAGAAIRICGSVEPEPKEIILAPQHWSE
jgi:hypothetical protein